MNVDRCVCFDVTFSRMKAYADEHQCGLDGLREHFGCGRGCALCVPYITAMLKTGQTTFPANLPSHPTDGARMR